MVYFISASESFAELISYAETARSHRLGHLEQLREYEDALRTSRS